MWPYHKWIMTHAVNMVYTGSIPVGHPNLIAQLAYMVKARV